MQPWWTTATAYHIYPRSFQDTNGDGVGDIAGIISRLDYLQDLGVDLIMLGPVYPSPDDDNGYDVADFCQIDPKYGTLDQWRELARQVHARGMRIMMDLVLNHTSDEHEWFRQSRSNANDEYRDFYWWRPAGVGDALPNNWKSVFSGSVWEYDDSSEEHFLHLYSRRQPDLNWENPQVRARVAEILQFWVDEGVDAFRLDSITTISKPAGLPDAPIVEAGELQPAHELIFNGPKLLPYLRELRQSIKTDKDILFVAEGPGVGVEQAVEFLQGPDNPVDLVLQWEHIDADPGSGGKWGAEWWTPSHFANTMTRWQEGLAGVGWNTLYLSNHDQARQVSRFGDDGLYWAKSATMLATATYLLQGTPFIYQGEEIGMTNVDYTRLTDFKDIESINYTRDLQERGVPDDEILRLLRRKSRDNGRSPMQWTSAANGGFSSATPWMPANGNHVNINAESQTNDPDSILAYYRRLLALRRAEEVIRDGDYALVAADEHVYAYSRRLGSVQLHVVANFSGRPQVFDPSAMTDFSTGRALIGNYGNSDWAKGVLQPYEAVGVLVEAAE